MHKSTRKPEKNILDDLFHVPAARSNSTTLSSKALSLPMSSSTGKKASQRHPKAARFGAASKELALRAPLRVLRARPAPWLILGLLDLQLLQVSLDAKDGLWNSANLLLKMWYLSACHNQLKLSVTSIFWAAITVQAITLRLQSCSERTLQLTARKEIIPNFWLWETSSNSGLFIQPELQKAIPLLLFTSIYPSLVIPSHLPFPTSEGLQRRISKGFTVRHQGFSRTDGVSIARQGVDLTSERRKKLTPLSGRSSFWRF